MEKIAIDSVDVSDANYCVSYPLNDNLLFSSIMRSGILMPVGLFSAEHPIVVTGFKRLHAARRLGIEKIPCVFLDVDEQHALLAAIMDNLGRPLNTIEKLRCIERMGHFGFPASEVSDMMKLLGLPVRERTSEAASAAAELDEKEKDFVVRHGLPITAVEQLLWFSMEERDHLTRLFDRLDMTVSSFREVAQLIILLRAKANKVDLDSLSEAISMADLKQRLKKLSHPFLTEMERALADLLKACALPPNIRLHIDPFFEREWVDVSVRARTADEIGDALRKMERLLQEGRFRSLFELTHGLSDRN